MKMESAPIKNTFEENKEAGPFSFLKKIERFIPKKLWGLAAGTSLLFALETAEAQEKFANFGAMKAPEEKIRILSPETEKLFDQKFNFSVQPKLERFAAVKGKDAIIDSVSKKMLPFKMAALYQDVTLESKRGYIIFKDSVNVADLQKTLDRCKTEYGKYNFKIDSLETRRTLDTEDYKKIFAGFFEDAELPKILALADTVRIIDSPEEKRKMPSVYGFSGISAAQFTKRGNATYIELEKHYLENERNVFTETEVIFHEFGHGFDPVTFDGRSRMGPVYPFFYKTGYTLSLWVEIMAEDQKLRKDSVDTFFDYPKKIADSFLREDEDFAESFSSYFLKPLWLQEIGPTRFKVIDTLVKAYLENPSFNIHERYARALRYLKHRYGAEEERLEKKINAIHKSF